MRRGRQRAHSWSPLAQAGLRYDVDDWGDQLVILTNAGGAEDFKIVTAPASAPGPGNWRDLVPYREGRQIVETVALSGHLVRLEREDGPRAVGHASQGRRQRAHHRHLARRPIRSISVTITSSTPAPCVSTIPRPQPRSRPSSTMSRAANGWCANRRRFRAATIRQPMWCDGSRLRRPTTRKCRSRSCTERICGSTARRRSFSKDTALIRLPSRRLSIRTYSRWSTADSFTPSPIFVVGWSGASAGAMPDGSGTRPTRSTISSRSPSI